MRFCIVGISLLFSLGLSWAQPQSLHPSVFKSTDYKTETSSLSQKALTTFWSDNFDTPALWVSENLVDSNANWSIDTVGPIGFSSGFMSPINSQSSGNFALFDSDFLAGGNANAQQNAHFSYVPSIDCSNKLNIALTFQSYLLHYSEQVFAEVSVDNLNWVSFQIHEELLPLEATPNPEFVAIDISSVAANQPNVYIRFRYQGAWDYAWMIDDIALSEITGHDVALENLSYNQYKIPFFLPKTQLSSYELSVKALNKALEIPSVTFQADMMSASYTSSMLLAIDALEEKEMVFDSIDLTQITDTGLYTIDFLATPANVADEDISNNQVSVSFTVTDSVLGYVSTPTNFFPSHDSLTFAQRFDLLNADTLTSVGVYMYFSPEALGEEIQLHLYSSLNGMPDAIVCSTEPYIISENDTAFEGSKKFFFDLVNEKQFLQSGAYYLSFEDDILGNVTWPFSNQVHIPGNSIYQLPNDTAWYEFGSFYNSVFSSYLHLKQQNIVVPSNTKDKSQQIVSVFPNPSSDVIYIDHHVNSKALMHFSITSMQGKTVRKGQIKGVNIDIKSLSSGTYFLTIFNGSQKMWESSIVISP